VSTKKPMNKWLLYTIFVAKFISGLGLIVWTIYMTMQSDVGEDNDNAFLSTYHSIDDNYNDMIISNTKLNSKYLITFNLNKEVIKGLSHEDIFLSQRAVEKRQTRKNILILGDNNFSINITDKSGNIIKDTDTKMLITMATNHKYDKRIEFKDNQNKIFNFNRAGYWNITGTVRVNNEKGYFYIKTNAR